jgi:hypothetical protein
MAAIYSNGGDRWNILGFNFTKRDALSSVYKISMVIVNSITNWRLCYCQHFCTLILGHLEYLFGIVGYTSGVSWFYSGKSPKDNSKYNGRLNTGPPLIPPAHHGNELTEFRSSLPIAELKENIMKEIENNRVSIWKHKDFFQGFFTASVFSRKFWVILNHWATALSPWQVKLSGVRQSTIIK